MLSGRLPSEWGWGTEGTKAQSKYTVTRTRLWTIHGTMNLKSQQELWLVGSGSREETLELCQNGYFPTALQNATNLCIQMVSCLLSVFQRLQKAWHLCWIHFTAYQKQLGSGVHVRSLSLASEQLNSTERGLFPQTPVPSPAKIRYSSLLAPEQCQRRLNDWEASDITDHKTKQKPQASQVHRSTGKI